MQTSAPSISEFELGLRWRQASATISLWRENRKGQVSPHFRVGMSTRYLLSDVEKFEAENNRAAIG